MSRFKEKAKSPDKFLIILTFALIFIGIVTIATAGIIHAHVLLKGTNDYFFFTQQILWAILGLIGMYIASQIPYTFWRKNALFLLIIGIIFLMSVFLPGLSRGEIKGAVRWIRIGPINAQPSEFIKIFLAIYLSAWLSNKKRQDIQDFRYGLIPFVLLIGAVVLLLELQSDLGTTIIIGMISFICFFISGASIVQLGLLVGVATTLTLILIKIEPYRMSRFTTFLYPFADKTGAGYHINQALLALGNGGLFGVGFGHSRQKYRYLPEPVTDSIFAIIGEEFGLIGGVVIISLFILFAWRAFQIARGAPDPFSKVLASAIGFWIPFQAFINIGAMASLVPMTGIPLPFVSYGGSSLTVTLFTVGILLNISRHSTYEETNPITSFTQWRRNRRSSLPTNRTHRA
ncbi:MAG: putative lipid II flippase FtsW [bacterium]